MRFAFPRPLKKGGPHTPPKPHTPCRHHHSILYYFFSYHSTPHITPHPNQQPPWVYSHGFISRGILSIPNSPKPSLLAATLPSCSEPLLVPCRPYGPINPQAERLLGKTRHPLSHSTQSIRRRRKKVARALRPQRSKSKHMGLTPS